MRLITASSWERGIAVTLLLLATGCAVKAPVSQPAGVLTIGVTTTGPGAPALTFTVDVRSSRPGADAPPSERIKADGGIATFRDLAAGPYVAQLSLPAQCQADGGAARPITIATSRTAAIRFAVRCR